MPEIKCVGSHHAALDPCPVGTDVAYKIIEIVMFFFDLKD